jgi:CRISPR-associated protein Cas1
MSDIVLRKLLVLRRKGRLRMKSRNVLQLQYESRDNKSMVREYPVRDLEALLIIGRGLFIESSVFSVLANMNIPVTIIAEDSIGIIMNPVIVMNPHYRKLQYSLDKIHSLRIALEYIEARIAGMINILKYYRREVPEIPSPPETISDPEEYEYRIRLWESQASNTLWDKLVELIDEPFLNELREEYGFKGRRPRHPDPFNKALSIMYAVLYSLATKALLAAGLDPTYGFLHKTRYSTPLTFDYTEMFKPIAIHATIDLINTYGLPQLETDGELDRDSINLTIKKLYEYLTLHHIKTGKTPYQYIYIKAYTLTKHLEGKTSEKNLAIIWNKKAYR